ncbi:MAG: hypothetical protein IJA61_04195 [Clostridia bacterium]|nr:hypothetical protein [Clostridia bacterium]
MVMSKEEFLDTFLLDLTNMLKIELANKVCRKNDSIFVVLENNTAKITAKLIN